MNFKHHCICWIISPGGRAACIAPWIWCRTVYRLIQKVAEFELDHSVNRPESHTLRICLLQNPKKSIRHCVSSLIVEGARCNNLSFTLEETSHAPKHWTGRNFTEVVGPWIFVRFISYPLTGKCLTNKSIVVLNSCTQDPMSILLSMWWASVMSYERKGQSESMWSKLSHEGRKLLYRWGRTMLTLLQFSYWICLLGKFLTSHTRSLSQFLIITADIYIAFILCQKLF